MFTGIIEETGSVRGISKSGDGYLLEIVSELVLEGTKIGDSISINGACQTVTRMGKGSFSVFVSKITHSVTTLGAFNAGKKVNLERAVQPSGRLGGHIVQGHVDGIGRIAGLKKDNSGIEAFVAVEGNLNKYLVEKGSVAIDGISLTVVSLTEKGAGIYLIPETVKSTTASEWKSGDTVNIETDILAKYVERMLLFGRDRENKGKDIKSMLMDEGFLS